MRTPLQEKLLKAGLVKKHNVDAAVREQAKQRQGKAPATPNPEQVNAQKLQAERAERDRALAAERNAQARAKELLATGRFRVALTPVIVLIGFRLPILIGGSVIVEQVFQWPGLGSLFVMAVRNKDLPVVMTIALLTVILVLVVSLIVDILTAIIDPRVRLGN